MRLTLLSLHKKGIWLADSRILGVLSILVLGMELNWVEKSAKRKICHIFSEEYFMC